MRDKLSARVSSRVRACNLLPDAMAVPVPEPTSRQRMGRRLLTPGDSHRFSWEPIRNVDRQPYQGPVYSMDVERFHHYIADGIVTHNCLYGWKEGAAHRFFGPSNATDLWHVKKVSPNAMVHLTEKPVELARRAIEYSSLPGEGVLDPFAGSGSTLVAVSRPGGGRTSWRSTRCTRTPSSNAGVGSQDRAPSGSRHRRRRWHDGRQSPPARAVRPGLPRRLARHPHQPAASAQAASAAERGVRPRLPAWPDRRRDLGPVPRVGGLHVSASHHASP